MTLAARCRKAGLNFYTVYNRIHKFGWTEEKALSTPPRPHRPAGTGLHRNVYMKHFRDKKKAWVQSLRDRPCTDCKQSFPVVCMDFDHVRGKKKFNIGKAFSRPKKAILKEIAKCEVVCSNCHRIRTYKRSLCQQTISS